MKDVVLLEKTELTAGSTWHAVSLQKCWDQRPFRGPQGPECEPEKGQGHTFHFHVGWRPLLPSLTLKGPQPKVNKPLLPLNLNFTSVIERNLYIWLLSFSWIVIWQLEFCITEKNKQMLKIKRLERGYIWHLCLENEKQLLLFFSNCLYFYILWMSFLSLILKKNIIKWLNLGSVMWCNDKHNMSPE